MSVNPDLFFTQFEQWVSLNDENGKSIGGYFESMTGGEPRFGSAQSDAANTRGRTYRITRFTISEITLEKYCSREFFAAVMEVVSTQIGKGTKKFQIQRTSKDGEGKKLTLLYGGCNIIAPPMPDDVDVRREDGFVMLRLQVQPESLKIMLEGEAQPIAFYNPKGSLKL